MRVLLAEQEDAVRAHFDAKPLASLRARNEGVPETLNAEALAAVGLAALGALGRRWRR